MRDFSCDADGVRLATRDYGGSGPGVLLLHGGGHNLATWDVVGPRLSDEFHIVAYDAVGHGQSDRLPDQPSPTLFVDHVDAVANAVGLNEPVLVGHSMGGATALRRAARGPGVAGVVAVDGAIMASGDHHYSAHLDLDAYREEMRAQGWGWKGTDDMLDERLRDAGAEQALTGRRGVVRNRAGMLEERPTLEDVVTTYAMGQALRDTVEIYDRIECPVLLLCSERYTMPYAGPVEESKALLADVSRRRANVEVEWCDAGHALHWEEPDVVEAHIRTFVRRTVAEPAREA